MARGDIRIIGEKELVLALGKLGDTLERRVVRGAVSAALTPVNKAAKRFAPVRTGALRKSIGKKITTYRKTGVVWGGVGPRLSTGKQGTKTFKTFTTTHRGKKVDPSNYAHLVEFGTVRMPAQSFLRKARDQQKSAALAILNRKIREGIERFARQQRRPA